MSLRPPRTKHAVAPRRLDAIAAARSTDRVRLRRAPLEDEREWALVGEAIRDAFTRPAAYRMWGWICEAAAPRTPNEGEFLEELSTWAETLAVAVARKTCGFAISAVEPATGEVMGGILVARQQPYSRWTVVRTAQILWETSVTLIVMLVVLAGLPPVAWPRNLWKDGVGPLLRMLAVSSIQDEQIVAVKDIPRERLYLVQVGTIAEFQGRGVGAALLRALCDVADEIDEHVYLETDEEHLRELYERFGFYVHHSYEVTSRGSVFVPNYAMVRPPRLAFSATAVGAGAKPSAGAARIGDGGTKSRAKPSSSSRARSSSR